MRRVNGLSIFIFFGFTAALAQQANPGVALEGATVARLGVGTTREVRVGVSPADKFQVAVSPSPEQPIVVEAAFNNVRSSELETQFTPTWELSGTTPIALKIGVSSKITQPGKYSLILNLQPKSHPGAPRLAIDIEQPAGDLDVPSKLTVQRTDYWPLGPSIQIMPLNIRESTRSADVTSLSTEWRPDSLVTGSVNVVFPPLKEIQSQCPTASSTTAPLTLPAGCTLKNVKYELQGEFPLGVVNGNLRFFGDQVAAPKTVSVEIQNRLTLWWPVIAIVTGLVLSYLLKVTLAKRIELNEARVKAQELLADVERDLARSADTTFRGSLAIPVSDLKAAIAGNNPADIEAKRSAADQAWRGAVTDLNNRMLAVSRLNDDWSVSTASLARLPGAVKTGLDAVRQKLNDATECLRKRDAAGANSDILQISRNLLPSWRDEGVSWQQAVAGLLTKIRTTSPKPLPGLPKPAMADFDLQLTQLPPDLNRLSAQSNASEPRDAAVLIENLAVEYLAIQDLLDQLEHRLEREWDDLSTRLLGVHTALRAGSTFDDVRKRYFGFLKTLHSAADDPVEWLRNLQCLADLQSSWRTAFAANASPGTEDEIGAIVEAQDYVQAAANLKEKVPGPGMLLGGDAKQMVEEHATKVAWPRDAIRGVTSGTVMVQPSLPTVMEGPGRFSGLALTPENQLRLDKLKQTAIVGVLLLGYILMNNIQSYKGTLNDVWNVFLTALAADFALDSILSKFRTKN